MSDEIQETEILVPEVVQSRVPQFIPPDLIEQFKLGGAQAVADAKLFTVETTEDYDLAMTFRQQAKRSIDRAKKIADPICQGLHQAHSAACDLRNEMIGDYIAADKALDILQKALMEKRQVAEELLKAKQLAEDKRIAEESRAALAAELERAGEPEQAKEVLQTPIVVEKPQNPSLMPKSKSGSNALIWKVLDDIDIIELARFVVDNPRFKHFIAADMTELRKYAVSTEGKEKIPGVTFKQDDNIRVKK